MLRSMKKGRKRGLQQLENPNPGKVLYTHQHNHHIDGPTAVALAQPTSSTMSLSTTSSIGSKSAHNQAQVRRQQNPISRILYPPYQELRRRPSMLIATCDFDDPTNDEVVAKFSTTPPIPQVDHKTVKWSLLPRTLLSVSTTQSNLLIFPISFTVSLLSSFQNDVGAFA
jgi:hypothetical protein